MKKRYNDPKIRLVCMSRFMQTNGAMISYSTRETTGGPGVHIGETADPEDALGKRQDPWGYDEEDEE